MDLEKVFDKVWHAGLIYKLDKMKMSKKSLRFIYNFITARQIQISINKKTLNSFLSKSWCSTSCLSPLLFSLFCSDIPVPNRYNFLSQYADDIAIWSKHVTKHKKNLVELIKYGEKIQEWCGVWKIGLNIEKTQGITFEGKSQKNYEIKPNNQKIENNKEIKFLDITLDKKLKMNQHLEELENKIKWSVHNFQNICYNETKINQKIKLTIYKSLIRSVIDYSMIPFMACGNENTKYNIEKIQNKCLRAILRTKRTTRTKYLLEQLHVQSIED